MAQKIIQPLFLCLLVTIAQGFNYQISCEPEWTIGFDKESLDGLKTLGEGFGKDLKISLKDDLPSIKITIDKETFRQIASLSKLLLGFSFALLGAFMVKNGCQSFGEKDKKTSSWVQISCGILTTIAGIIYMHNQ